MTGARAKLMARRAAEVVAVRNLAASLRGQPVPAGQAGVARSRLDGVVRGFRYLPARELPDGTIEVTVELKAPGSACSRSAAGQASMESPSTPPPYRAETRAMEVQAEMDRARAQLEAQAARLMSVISELEQQIEALRAELVEVRAALADLR